MQFDQLKRREFITLLSGTAAAWPLAVHAQQAGKIRRIGFLANDPNIPAQKAGQAFLDGLRESGFIEGKNVIIERRFAEGRIDQYAALVSELINSGAGIIVTSANDATLAAKQATSQIPIVMMNVYDPVGQGIVQSLARPGGNITGVIQDESAEIAAKRLQLLKDAVPNISRVAVLINMDEPYANVEWKALEQGAQSLRLRLQAIAVHRVSEYADAFDQMTKENPDAVFVAISAPLNFTNRRLIVEQAAKRRLPTVSNFRETTEVGGLMSYGSVRTDRFRRAGVYVGKILKGAKPGDLPIEQPTKFELVINLKTARSLDLEIPRELLLVADEVIE
jgi:putative tryptophan/tyrosine transport system substrate-binding protein